MLKSVPISVPLGEGLQHSQHEWKVRPPAALEVHNAHLRDGQSVTKRTPSTFLTSVSSGRVSPILIAQDFALALLNESGAHVISGNTIVSQGFGGAIPTEVASHRVLPFRGSVTGAQVAYNANSGLYGLVLTESDPETGTNAVALVVNEGWEIVAGPERISEIAYHPRIEPLGAGFAFFGLAGLDTLPTSTDTSDVDPFKETADLYYVYWAAGPGFLTPAKVSTNPIPLSYGDETNVKVAYDTCPGSQAHEAVYVVYREEDTAVDTVVTKVSDSLVLTSQTILLNVGVDSNDAIWYDADSDTLVVYDGANNQLWTNDGNLGLTPGTVPHPSSPLGEYPVFFIKGPLVTLNDRSLIFSGGTPRAVAIGETSGYTPVLHRRPQPREPLGAYYVRDYEKVVDTGRAAVDTSTGSRTDLGGERLVGGKALLLAEEYAATSGGGVFDGRIVTVLAGDALPILRMEYFSRRAYNMYIENPDDPDDWVSRIGEKARVGVVGQTVKVGDTIILPHLVANAAYLPPPFLKEDDAMLDPTDQFANFRSAHYKTGGAGVSEGTEQLTITEVKLYTPNYSALDYYGTTLVAAGGLSCFDGKESFPATLDTPLSATVAVTSVDPTAHPDNLASFINQFWLLPGESVDFKGVLVHIDRNGVKYRSGEFDLGTVSNDSGDTHRYSLAFELELSETLAPFSLNGHRLSLEVYTNERYTTTPGEEFNLMFRGGVYWNETFSTFMADATSMVGPSNGAGNTDAWHFNPVPIYTSSGELTSVIPPASNVMAQAGNYIFLVSSEDPYDIRFTKPLDDRIGPEFNPLLSLEAPPESGGVVSLAGEADRLLLLCRTGVWELFVAGSGPDAAGQGTFPPFRRIWGGEGCITHRGTVSGPFGTFFVADSGPKIVGRDGSVVDVALDLGLTDFSDLVRTVYVSADQELWMFMGDGAYVFDLARGQWTSASSTALAVAVKDRQMFRLTNDAELFQHTSSPGGEQILAKYVSPWLSFDGPMGLKRVRRIGALVRVISGSIGKLRVSVAYDYIDTEVDSAEWASSELGSLVKPVQLLVRPSRQKADSYRITVEEVGEAPPQGDPVSDLRWSLVDISLEVAAKGGLIKLQTEAKK